MNHFKSFRWLLFGMIGALYFLAHFHRMAPTVIARDLALAFDADAMVLGMIASTYFYLYSVSQPVVGYLSDTVGPAKGYGGVVYDGCSRKFHIWHGAEFNNCRHRPGLHRLRYGRRFYSRTENILAVVPGR